MPTKNKWWACLLLVCKMLAGRDTDYRTCPFEMDTRFPAAYQNTAELSANSLLAIPLAPAARSFGMGLEGLNAVTEAKPTIDVAYRYIGTFHTALPVVADDISETYLQYNVPADSSQHPIDKR